MITKLEVWDAEKIASVELDTLVYPLQKFDWDYPIIGDDIQKPFSAGRWDTRKSVGNMNINCEGLIIGTTTSTYWAARKALVGRVLPQQTQPTNIWHHSYVEMTLDDSSIYTALLQLSSFSIPLTTSGSPLLSPFMFSWTCNVGYWSVRGTGQRALI